MRKIIESIESFILVVFIIAVLGGMTVFTLDVFGIIEMPEKYSLINLISSTKEVISTTKTHIEDNTISKNSNNIEESIIVEFEPNTNNQSRNPQELINEVKNETKKENKTSASRFYYQQLDSYGKIIYDGLYKNRENLKSGTYTVEFDRTFNELLQQENGADILNNAFQLSVNSFMFDNPEFFYIDIPKMYLLTEITTKAFSKTYKVSIGSNEGNYLYNEFVDRASLNYMIDQIEEIKDYIVSNATGSDYQKIKYIHDYLVDNIEYYKGEGSFVYTIYGALGGRKAVCEGYAKSFKYLLDNLGIPCVIVCGIGRNSEGETESHAWNYVELEGKWYAVDATWDDPIIIGNGYITDDIKYEYFLKGSNSFFEDHAEDGAIINGADFKYPKLSVIDY